MTAPVPTATIRNYHAHIYYDPGVTEDAAARLRDRVAEAFPGALLGRWHAVPVGPHTRAMFQIAFPAALFASLVPWLLLNRDGLDILLHPETGDDPADHTTHAAWLGEKLPLHIEALQGRK
ncbi:DOPA 4,5-dioxygenase family protein [Lichenicoccus sp.]|uniref:DOPA 4,5-dioxygenase family protein n=1 Tax=Lichenicoccus sp. TaxID=2781899 RepID=UPI003D0C779C